MGFCNKYSRGLNNQHLLFTVLEAGKSKFRAPTDPVSGEDLPPGLQKPLPSVSSCGQEEGGGERGKESTPGRALSPSRARHSHDLITFQRPPLLTTSHWELRFPHMRFRWTHHSVHNSPSQIWGADVNPGKCSEGASPGPHQVQWFGLCTCLGAGQEGTAGPDVCTKLEG